MAGLAKTKSTSATTDRAKTAECASTNKRLIHVHVFSVQYIIIYTYMRINKPS